MPALIGDGFFTDRIQPCPVFQLRCFILHGILSLISSLQRRSQVSSRNLSLNQLQYTYFSAHITRLRKDHDAFFGIISEPQLRQYVEQLVRYDVPSLSEKDEEVNLYYRDGFENGRDRWSYSDGSSTADCDQSYDPLMDMLPQLTAKYRAASWIADTRLDEKGPSLDVAFVEPTNGILEEFVTALEAMPLLRTVVVRPLPYDRFISTGIERTTSLPYACSRIGHVSLGMRVLPCFRMQ